MGRAKGLSQKIKGDVWLSLYWGTLIQWTSVEIQWRLLDSSEAKAGYNTWKNNNETLCRQLSAGCQGCCLDTNHLFEVIVASVKVLVEIWRNPSSYSSSLFWVRMN